MSVTTMELDAVPTKKSSRIRGRIATALFLIALTLWAIFLRPAALGGPLTYVIVSGGSMEPTLHNGDLVITRRQPTYEVGDVVAFKVPEGEAGEGSTVIHRIIQQAPDGYVLQGDNRSAPDLWRPEAGDIRGKLWVRTSGIGRYLGLGRSPLALALFAAGVAFVLIVTAPRRARSKDGDTS